MSVTTAPALPTASAWSSDPETFADVLVGLKWVRGDPGLTLDEVWDAVERGTRAI
ncbi:hypothetical protein [Streptomyces albus]|uniref:hypothetical protein n=1 Tax=Streptomyces sp. NRRL F-5917 TaxID=1463873 RepID=UPI000AA93B7C|nr:hypothetical protein [Streptomyces sp. NRRL F-5917]